MEVYKWCSLKQRRSYKFTQQYHRKEKRSFQFKLVNQVPINKLEPKLANFHILIFIRGRGRHCPPLALRKADKRGANRAKFSRFSRKSALARHCEMSREDGAVLSIYGANVNADWRPRVPYLTSFVKQRTCLPSLRQFLSSYGIVKVFEPPLSYKDVKCPKKTFKRLKTICSFGNC